MPCPDKVPLKSYLTQEEYESVIAGAKAANLSISRYVKTVVLGYEVKSKIDNMAVLEISKSTANLARLGGLLKKALGEHPDMKELRPLLHSIEKSHRELKTKVNAVVKTFLQKQTALE